MLVITEPNTVRTFGPGDHDGPVLVYGDRCSLHLERGTNLRIPTRAGPVVALLPPPAVDADGRPVTVIGDEQVPCTLDKSVAGKWALNLPPGRRVQWHGDGLTARFQSVGRCDYWRGVRRFQVRLAVSIQDPRGDLAMLVGFDGSQENANPWILLPQIGEKRWLVWLTLEDGTRINAAFPAPPWDQMQRLAITVDLDAGMILAATGPGNDPVEVTPISAPLRPGARLRPFGRPYSGGFQFFRLPWAYQVHGFKIVYDPPEDAPRDDWHRYFTDEPGDYCYYTGEPHQERLVVLRHNGAESLGLFLEDRQNGPGPSSLRVTGPGTIAGTNSLGVGIALGAAQAGTFLQVGLVDGTVHAVSNIPGTGVHYPLWIDGGRFRGDDAALDLHGTMTLLTGYVQLVYASTTFARLIASGVQVTGKVFCTNPEAEGFYAYLVALGGDDDGELDLDHFQVDHESREVQPACGAGFWIDTSIGQGSLDVVVRASGSNGLLRPLVRVGGERGENRPCQLILRDQRFYKDQPADVICDTPGRWAVEFAAGCSFPPEPDGSEGGPRVWLPTEGGA